MTKLVLHHGYRGDIDGLRAIAVLSVVIFHAFPRALPGGFIGVDIFFVISGYLISSIIFTDIGRGFFSLADFYARRVRRIFPALALVLLTSFAIGWTVLDAGEFQQLGMHIIGAATFTSNFILYGESGYFDNAAATKPLLHLWSLGIEEQFYLLFPMTMWMVRSQRRLALACLIVSTAVSFWLSIYMHRVNAAAAFYLPQFRIWELLAGSLLAFARHHEMPNLRHIGGRLVARPFAASIAGGAAILIGLLFTPEAAFPGWWALLPVMGATLIIGAGPDAPINRYILTSKPLVLIGLISYPLYLWHWPLLSFARIVIGAQPPALLAAYIVALSFALASLTYLCFEKPLRFQIAKRQAVYFSCTFLSLLGLFASAVVWKAGFPERAAVRLNASFAQNPGTDLALFRSCSLPDGVKSNFRACAEDARGPYSLALLGDSKAQAAYPYLQIATADGYSSAAPEVRTFRRAPFFQALPITRLTIRPTRYRRSP